MASSSSSCIASPAAVVSTAATVVSSAAAVVSSSAISSPATTVSSTTTTPSPVWYGQLFEPALAWSYGEMLCHQKVKTVELHYLSISGDSKLGRTPTDRVNALLDQTPTDDDLVAMSFDLFLKCRQTHPTAQMVLFVVPG